MNATNTIMLEFYKSNRNALPLVFKTENLTMTQARLAGRSVLKPDINIKDFRCKAAIDWISVDVYLNRISQFQYVRSVMKPVLADRLPHAKPIDPQAGNTSTTFRIRFQEPRLFKVVDALDALEAEFGFSRLPKLDALEVCVDLMPKMPSDEQRALLFGVLQRTFVPTRDVLSNYLDRPRFNWGRENTAHIFPARKKAQIDYTQQTTFDQDRSPSVDSTLYFGKDGGQVMWRLMDKVIDTQNPEKGSQVDLPDSKKRVRLEVTLGRQELLGLGLDTIGDLAELNFTRLQKKYFRFLLPTFNDYESEPRMHIRAVRIHREKTRLEKFMRTGSFGVKAMDSAHIEFSRRMRPQMKRNLRSRGLTISPSSRVGIGSESTLVAFKELCGAFAFALRKLREREMRDIRKP